MSFDRMSLMFFIIISFLIILSASSMINLPKTGTSYYLIINFKLQKHMQQLSFTNHFITTAYLILIIQYCIVVCIHTSKQPPYDIILLQESERRCEELVMQVPDSTRPLLRQIEAMQVGFLYTIYS